VTATDAPAAAITMVDAINTALVDEIFYSPSTQ